MNRRIRKKRRVGEFNWKGFEVEATFDPPLEDVDKFLDDYLVFCDAHNLLTGGGMKDTSFGQFVTSAVAGGTSAATDGGTRTPTAPTGRPVARRGLLRPVLRRPRSR